MPSAKADDDVMLITSVSSNLDEISVSTKYVRRDFFFSFVGLRYPPICKIGISKKGGILPLTIKKLHVLASSKLTEKNYDFEISLNFGKLRKDYTTNVTVKSVHVFFFFFCDRRPEKNHLV